MPVNKRYAEKAAQCRFSIVDAFTLEDGSIMPLYACTHESVAHLSQKSLVICGANDCCCFKALPRRRLK